MGRLTTALGRGLIGGAAGTMALNAATYLDMVLRGRPASCTPESTVDRAAGLLHVDIPGDDAQRDAGRTALGSLLGSAAGVGAGAALGAARATGHPRGAAGTLALSWVLATVVGNGPMTALGVTDPRTWAAKDWAADVVPTSPSPWRPRPPCARGRARRRPAPRRRRPPGVTPSVSL